MGSIYIYVPARGPFPFQPRPSHPRPHAAAYLHSLWPRRDDLVCPCPAYSIRVITGKNLFCAIINPLRCAAPRRLGFPSGVLLLLLESLYNRGGRCDPPSLLYNMKGDYEPRSCLLALLPCMRARARGGQGGMKWKVKFIMRCKSNSDIHGDRIFSSSWQCTHFNAILIYSDFFIGYARLWVWG